MGHHGMQRSHLLVTFQLTKTTAIILFRSLILLLATLLPPATLSLLSILGPLPFNLLLQSLPLRPTLQRQRLLQDLATAEVDVRETFVGRFAVLVRRCREMQARDVLAIDLAFVQQKGADRVFGGGEGQVADPDAMLGALALNWFIRFGDGRVSDGRSSTFKVDRPTGPAP